jgi:tetratricopeptide (TPR) repeat protein
MKTLSYKLICLTALFFVLRTGIAQSEDVTTLHETARSLMRQGDFENALLVLHKAILQEPDNIDLLKDQAFVLYLKRDFAGAIDSSKKIVTRPDADVQSYQILGLAYKAIAEYKESEKMYKDALKRFPKSGVLYSEYGELLQQNNKTPEAIKQWESGIEVDPNYSSNYYYAAKYYAQKGNVIWGVLYSEIFVNIESLSKRTDEIKEILYGGYKKIFSSPSSLVAAKAGGTPFEKAVATNFLKLSNLMTGDVTPETLTQLRTRFILNWFNGPSRQFAFRLFEHQRTMLQEGYFEAYDQWLIGALADTQKYQAWVQQHAAAVKSFQDFQRNVLFKIPEGQYYAHS